MVLAFVNSTNPGVLLAAIALIPLPWLSQDCISALIVQVGATGAVTTCKTFPGRSGLVSGEVYEGESAASVYEREGRDTNQ